MRNSNIVQIWNHCLLTNRSLTFCSRSETNTSKFTRPFLPVRSVIKPEVSERLTFIFLTARSVFVRCLPQLWRRRKRGKRESLTSQSRKEKFLRFIYTGEVNNLFEHVIELLAAAHKYKVEDLKKLCTNHLLYYLSDENAEEVFQYAHLYDCERNLKQKSFFLIQQYVMKWLSIKIFQFVLSQQIFRQTQLRITRALSQSSKIRPKGNLLTEIVQENHASNWDWWLMREVKSLL